MKVVIQRVSNAEVTSGNYKASIERGLVALVAVAGDDLPSDIEFVADKTVNLRIFPDREGKLNLSLKEIDGEVLAISQFTLYGDCSKGRRPSFTDSAEKDKAKEYFDTYVEKLKEKNVVVKTGLFGEDMKVRLTNDGPVTLIIESVK